MSDGFAPRAHGTDEVLFARQGQLGRVRLNRPRVVNALTPDMVVTMRAQLEDWATDDAVTAVAIDGAGERGLCAGGDIRSIRQQVVDGDHAAPAQFWADEYRLNALIHRFPKPYAALMSGVVMGGGVGVSAYGSLRLATQDARVGMPETGIGFFPDVGVLSLLSRAPGELGTHLALTGSIIGGADAVLVGLADAVVDRAILPAVLQRLADGEAVTAHECETVDGTAPLAAERHWIDSCYAGADPAGILQALQAHPAPGAHTAAELLASRSPLSVAVTLAAIRRAAGMTTLEQVLSQDRQLGRAFLVSSDFVEGVRSVLIARDHAPCWRHRSLQEVESAEVQAMFEPQG